MVWGTFINKIDQLCVAIICVDVNETYPIWDFHLDVFAVSNLTLLPVDLLQDYGLWSREYDLISKSVQLHHVTVNLKHFRYVDISVAYNVGLFRELWTQASYLLGVLFAHTNEGKSVTFFQVCYTWKSIRPQGILILILLQLGEIKVVDCLDVSLCYDERIQMNFRLVSQVWNHFFCVEDLFLWVAHDLFILNVLASSVLTHRTLYYSGNFSVLFESLLGGACFNAGHERRIMGLQRIIQLLRYVKHDAVEAIHAV